MRQEALPRGPESSDTNSLNGWCDSGRLAESEKPDDGVVDAAEHLEVVRDSGLGQDAFEVRVCLTRQCCWVLTVQLTLGLEVSKGGLEVPKLPLNHSLHGV